VILDSPVGLHQGGQVAAPVFQRVAQQVLAYLNVPHDTQLPPSRQVLLAARKVSNDELEEGSPDHLGAALEMNEAQVVEPPPAAAAKPSPIPSGTVVDARVVPAGLKTKEVASTPAPAQASVPASELPKSGTVVLEVEQGGVEVPSFVGKNLRAAVGMAQDSGLELDVVGSGVAAEQSPPAGAHVPAGSRITVKFQR
jgi:cell division protein FtsI (penicillin-binding protein 3)